jgi:hypothetical protein
MTPWIYTAAQVRADPDAHIERIAGFAEVTAWGEAAWAAEASGISKLEAAALSAAALRRAAIAADGRLERMKRRDVLQNENGQNLSEERVANDHD